MKTILPQKSVILDKNDRKILLEMISNCRQPLSAIARSVHLSRASVEYRLKQLEEKKLITGYRAVVNVSKLGYKKFHLFLTFQHPPEERLFLEKAEKADFVNAILTYHGSFTIEIAIAAKSEADFQEQYHSLLPGIKTDQEHLLVIMKTLKAAILPSEEKMVEKIKREVRYDPDPSDLAILKHLADHARLTNSEIAEKTGLSRDIIAYRIKKLVDSNYLLHFRPALNYLALGLGIHAILLKVHVHDQLHQQLESFLIGASETIWIAKTIGAFDYIIYLLTEDGEQFHRFFDTVKERFGETIHSYQLLMTHSQRKYSYMPGCIKLDSQLD